MEEKELSQIIAEELDLAREKIYRRLMLRKGCCEVDGDSQQPSRKCEWSFITLE
jgi:hypothetical protein